MIPILIASFHIISGKHRICHNKMVVSEGLGNCLAYSRKSMLDSTTFRNLPNSCQKSYAPVKLISLFVVGFVLLKYTFTKS